MSNDLISAFANETGISSKDFISLKYGVKRRTGERFVKATTFNGMTFIKTLSLNGIETSSLIKIPAFNTKEERDLIIKDLSNTYTQSDIADMLDISQSTVSNVLKNNK